MTGDSWVKVAVFEELIEARVLEVFFNKRRIEARTYHDKILQLLLFLCPPRSTYQVQVRHGFAKHAIELLETDLDAPTILQKAIHCPECGSLSVDYPQLTRKSFLPTLLMHLGIVARVIEHQCCCEHCHCVWYLSKKTPVARRVPC